MPYTAPNHASPFTFSILCSLLFHGCIIAGMLISMPQRHFPEYQVVYAYMATLPDLHHEENSVKAPSSPQVSGSAESAESGKNLQSATRRVEQPTHPQPSKQEVAKAHPQAALRPSIPAAAKATFSPIKRKQKISAETGSLAQPEDSEMKIDKGEQLPRETSSFTEKQAAIRGGASATENRPLQTDQFVAEHQSDIRDKVMAILKYPAMARRMKWQGQVQIGFILYPSGEISHLEIKKSSGYRVLDTQALEAVKTAAPFATPQVEISMTLPIAFHLD